MKGWLAATAFLIGMNVLAAAMLFVGFTVVRSLHLVLSTERTVIGWLAIGTLVSAMLLARATLRRIERHG